MIRPCTALPSNSAPDDAAKNLYPRAAAVASVHDPLASSWKLACPTGRGVL